MFFRKIKLIVFVLLLLVFVSAGCEIVKLKQEVPSSPKESYMQLPE